ncbi:hypothetical protein KCP70_07830 [Salmonella enterica subsp. enterica]|nr:hypothetical protein KCP70_07830 [Salmonella enterica subsp. enterica]
MTPGTQARWRDRALLRQRDLLPGSAHFQLGYGRALLYNAMPPPVLPLTGERRSPRSRRAAWDQRRAWRLRRGYI